MFFGVLAAICVASAAALLIRLHLLPTGLHPVPDAISDYGTTRFHAYYRVMAILLGAGGILLAMGLARSTDAHDLIWLWLYGLSRLAISGFMTDREPPFTLEGRIHWLLAAVAFTAIALAASNIDWTGAPDLLRTLGYGVAATAVGTLLTRVVLPLRGIFGLVERLLYLTSIIWLLVAAISLAANN